MTGWQVIALVGILVGWAVAAQALSVLKIRAQNAGRSFTEQMFGPRATVNNVVEYEREE